MLVKFFHQHGTGGADSATAYLLAEAPARYLAGMRDSRGRIRNPRPVVVKGQPDYCRQLINALRAKQRHVYTSGVLSFKELIDPGTERKIIRRFESVAFSGLRKDQYECDWVRHSHLGRTELHFLSPRCELTTGKALNIKPARPVKEGLFDVFRKLVNDEFNLKDPSGTPLTTQERERLRRKLAALVAGRAAYNRSRYPACDRDKSTVANLLSHERTRLTRTSVAAARPAIPQSRPATRPAIERLECAARTIGQATHQLERATQRLGDPTRALPGRLIEAINRRHRRVASRRLLARYSIPERARDQRATPHLERDELERDLADEL